MKDELKKELLAILHKRMCYCNLHTDEDYENTIASILSLLDPELEKARKWDALIAMVKCEGMCVTATLLNDALDEKEAENDKS